MAGTFDVLEFHASALHLVFASSQSKTLAYLMSRYFLDRDGSTFKYVLAYLRGDRLPHYRNFSLETQWEALGAKAREPGVSGER